MRQNPALLTFWDLRSHRWMGGFIFFLLISVGLAIAVIDWNIYYKIFLLLAVATYLYFIKQPLWQSYSSIRLGYCPAEGWWVYEDPGHDKIWIDVCPQSRLTGFGLCFIYQKVGADAKRVVWVPRSAVVQGDYRAFCRIFRLTASRRGAHVLNSRECVEASYQGPADWK